jgi:hypothetical protein
MAHIKQYLNNKLSNIYKHTQKIQEIDAMVKPFLPHDLKKHTTATSFQQGILCLGCNAQYATNLRFFMPELIKILRGNQVFAGLISIKIIILEPILPEPIKINEQKVSAESKAKIAASSEHISYKPLQDALNRLARNDKT